ncbi:hypothetical protein GGX14DRAFT_457691 [Mycena pura]|uniref:MYND-type domain-containing protein n=1 Tax=Mycena pura TaxID=153505 RepID=A0AAD6V9L5_9AGAR|nr:hypothetical protein GGX14DRAFT_457691 [Mycena pura]
MASTSALVAQAIQSLADPRAPEFCCKYYICLLAHVELDNASIWENPIVRDAPYASEGLQLQLGALTESMALLDVLSAFITTDRSRADMAALAHRMEHCACDRADRLVDGMHAWTWSPVAYCRDPSGFVCRTDTLEGLIAVIADLVFNALQLHDLHQTRWPRTRRHCLAGNDEAAATMLCRWLDVYPILPLLRAISAAAASFGEPVLVPFLRSVHLPKNLVAILKRGVDALPADFEGGFNPFGVVYPITLVCIALAELCNLNDGVSIAYFFREHCPLFLETLNRVIVIDGKMKWASDGHWETGIFLGGAVHAKLVLPFDERMYHARILAASRYHRTAILDVQAPYQLARNIMLALAELPPQCMDSRCAAGAVCSGCRRVAYCGAQCQDRDWGGPLPHKKVCKKIRALGDAAAFPVYANPKSAPPQLDVDDFRSRVHAAVPLPAVNAFNKNMIEDDRIRRVVNDKYSARYPRLLD